MVLVKVVALYFFLSVGKDVKVNDNEDKRNDQGVVVVLLVLLARNFAISGGRDKVISLVWIPINFICLDAIGKTTREDLFSN